MTLSARTTAGILLVTFVLVLAGCTGGARPVVQPPPKPARPALNPFQADVRARAYTLRLAAATNARSGSSGSGAAVISIAAGRDRVCWNITRLSGVPEPLFAYIHQVGQGDSGPVVIPLGTGYQPAGCVAGVAPALLVEIEAHPSRYYLAIHNRAHPLGAIRGRL
jgi:hypothetical protein